MANDRYASYPDTPTSPASSAVQITPDDGTDLSHVTLALNVATAGTVRVTTKSGTTADIFVAPGVLLPIRVSRIWATGTTATGICALF